ncbi:uncharacterized protein LOC110455149 isoform X2 [Mizuhopecten yessoensis]|uniref:uncharacterized protein LOC110455149 isoform X2 n=1 Tax=Mizuhopecten yessoensis TaxID=6573 RepID=UPI000B45ED18|nr:uncharacterized protein LOC110455149 isoform X2 [Mizuhopecten yessoensis]
MAGVGVSHEDMRITVQLGDVSQIEAWVRTGLDLARWRDRNGDNVYHIYVKYGYHCDALCVMEAIPRVCPTHSSLITEPNSRGITPLVRACQFSTLSDDWFTLAVLEFLIHHSQNINYDQLLRMAQHRKTHRFLSWRKKNPSGLPESIRRTTDQKIMRYINTVESMDKEAAKRYRDAMAKECGRSRSIRIYYVGFNGVGKSTLCRNMRGVSTQGLTSTDLMEAFIQRQVINTTTGKLRNITDDMEHHLALDKINREMAFERMKRKAALDKVKEEMESEKGQNQVDFGRGISGFLSSVKQKFINPFVSMFSKKKHTDNPESCAMTEELAPGEETVHLSEPKPSQSLEQESSTGRDGKALDRQKRDERSYDCAVQLDVLQLEEMDEEAYVSMWDFGGEELFVNTNHLFLSGDAVYLLVFNLLEYEDPSGRMRSMVKFWLKSVNSLSKERTSKTKQSPPVIMIGTFLDKIPGTQWEKDEKAAYIKEKLFNDPDLKAISEKHVVAFFPLSNVAGNRGKIKQIWRAVLEAAPFQSHWHTEVPLAWLAIEREIMLLKSKNVKILTLQDVFNIAKNLEFDIEDLENCVLDALRYFNRTGLVLSVVLNNANCKVVINPMWLVKNFRLIITVQKFQTRHDSLDHYNKTGEITLDLIRLLLKQGDEENHFPDHEEVLVYYMERLALITRPLTREGQATDDVFVVPCILPAADPETLRHIIESPGTTKTSTLSFLFRNVFVSSPVYDKLLASCIYCFEAAKLAGETQCLQRGFGCFQLNPRWDMVIHCEDCIIKVTLFSANKISKVKPGEGFYVKNVIATMLNNVLITNQQQHLVDTFELCLDKSYFVLPAEEPVPENVVSQSSEPIVCPGPAGTQTVSQDDRNVWFVDPSSVKVPTEVSLPFTADMLEKRLTPRQMSHVAKCIGTSYCVLFIEIGLEMDEIENVKHDCRQLSTRTLITLLIRKWSIKFGPKAVFGRIYHAMKSREISTDKLFTEMERKLPTANAPQTSNSGRLKQVNDEYMLVGDIDKMEAYKGKADIEGDRTNIEEDKTDGDKVKTEGDGWKMERGENIIGVDEIKVKRVETMIGEDESKMERCKNVIGGGESKMERCKNVIGGGESKMERCKNVIGGGESKMERCKNVIGGGESKMERCKNVIGGGESKMERCKNVIGGGESKMERCKNVIGGGESKMEHDRYDTEEWERPKPKGDKHKSVADEEKIEDYRGKTEVGEAEDATNAYDDKSPTTDELSIIAGKIGMSYIIFFLELGLQIEEIEQAILDHSTKRSAFLSLLQQWEDAYRWEAMFTWIYKAMREANLDDTALRDELSSTAG